MKVDGILETCIYVDDLAAAEFFYGDVLGLEFVSRQPQRHVFFRCGERMLLIFNPQESSRVDGELPPHGCNGAGHVAFAVEDASLHGWQSQLDRHQIAIEKAFEWPGGGRSLYFRDPAGNSVELATPRIWGIEAGETTAITPTSE